MTVAAWQYYKSPRHPRDGRRAKPFDLLRPVAFRFDRYRHQTQSPLFQLPPELRALIFDYALREYVDYDHPRAAVAPPRECHPASHSSFYYHVKVDTALLKTCQRVYHEAWWVPLATANLTLNRNFVHPIDHRLGDILEIYHRRHSLRLQGRRIEIDRVRIVNPFNLRGISTFANLPYFYPKHVTLRATNFDPRYRWIIHTPQAFLVQKAWLPSSVQELRFELETIEQSREELLLLINLLRATWAFDRVDGVRLVSNPNTRLQLYRWVPCLNSRSFPPLNSNASNFIGMATSFYPISKDDARSSLPLELPTLHSWGEPLTYGKPLACRGCSYGSVATVEYALGLAKYPLVSRSWVPPRPLPDLPTVSRCSGCGSGKSSKQVTESAPVPAPTPAAVPSQLSSGGSAVNSTSAIPTTAAPSMTAVPTPSVGSSGGTAFYGATSTQDLPRPVSAPSPRPKKATPPWWQRVWAIVMFMYFSFMAWRLDR